MQIRIIESDPTVVYFQHPESPPPVLLPVTCLWRDRENVWAGPRDPGTERECVQVVGGGLCSSLAAAVWSGRGSRDSAPWGQSRLSLGCVSE